MEDDLHDQHCIEHSGWSTNKKCHQIQWLCNARDGFYQKWPGKKWSRGLRLISIVSNLKTVCCRALIVSTLRPRKVSKLRSSSQPLSGHLWVTMSQLVLIIISSVIYLEVFLMVDTMQHATLTQLTLTTHAVHFYLHTYVHSCEP